MKFVRIEMLLLIWVLPVLLLIIVYGFRHRKRILNRYASGKGRLTIGSDTHQTRRWMKWGFVLTGLLFLTLSLTGPQYGYQWHEMEQKGIDIIIALDCSKSMLANDIQPTRLDRAKREVVDLLHMLRGDRVGLVAFAGTAFLQCPLTVDYQAFYLFLDTLTPGFLPLGGTDLHGAIQTAVAGFSTEDTTQKAIILVTDGENTGESPNAAVEKAKVQGIKIFTIGVGKDMGVPVPSESGGLIKDVDGKIVVTRLDEDMLKDIAVATDGLYVRSVAGDMDLEAIYENEIREKMETSTLASGKKQVWEDRFQWFLIFAIVLFLADIFLPGAAKKRSSLKNFTAMVVCFLFIFPSLGFAETTYSMVEKGIKAYDKGDYETALKHFIDAQVKSPERSEIYYNIGNTYYKLADYDAAINNYTEVLNSSDEALKHKARYNLGNAKFRKQLFEDAISEYENAINLNPDDQKAKDNLEFARRMLERQQQQSPNQPEKPSDGQEQNQTQDKQDNKTQEENDQSQQDASNDSPQISGDPSSKPNENGSDEGNRQKFGNEMNDPGENQTPDDNTTDEADASTNQMTEQGVSKDELEKQQAERMLNRLKDSPGKALIPAYTPREVEKDW